MLRIPPTHTKTYMYFRHNLKAVTFENCIVRTLERDENGGRQMFSITDCAGTNFRTIFVRTMPVQPENDGKFDSNKLLEIFLKMGLEFYTEGIYLGLKN